MDSCNLERECGEMNGVSTRRKKECNVHILAFMYVQSIGPQLTFIKNDIVRENWSWKTLLQIECDDIYTKIGF